MQKYESQNQIDTIFGIFKFMDLTMSEKLIMLGSW